MSISMEPNYWGPDGRGDDRVTQSAAALVYAQETTDGKWIWWITMYGNNATVARSAREYTTKRGALNAAKAVASLGYIDIDWRNLT